jgi:hypothetical protein
MLANSRFIANTTRTMQLSINITKYKVIYGCYIKSIQRQMKDNGRLGFGGNIDDLQRPIFKLTYFLTLD